MAVALAALLWSVGAVVASDLFDRGVSPMELVEFRTFITAACLGAVVLWMTRARSGRASPKVTAEWPWLVCFGLAIGVANASLFFAIDHLPVAVAIVLQNLAPAFVVMWVLLTTRRMLSVRVAGGLALSLAGVIFVVQLPTTPLGDIDALGVIFGITTAAGVAAFSLLGARTCRIYGSVRANAVAFGVSAACWALIQAVQGVPSLASRTDLLPEVLVVGVLGTFAPFLLFAWGTARLGPETGALSISLEPVFAAALAWIWLGQSLAGMQILGAVAILAGIVRVQSASPLPPVEASGPSQREQAPRPV
ncbi:MAG TPA: EamA family transporter [Jatrophihabitans sp.]|jgi:drug/metabolite transporter (DMT)-like permease|uniref:EamA family transporter n=1 Tax=Jatrophihabitans sp. TaxID=1932789 RepID=UPI002F048305